MRVFVCGSELGLGFVVAQRLIAQGHRIVMLTSFDDLIPNLRKNGMNPVLGEIEDAEPRRQLARADAVIDAELPLTWPLKRVQIARLRPALLRRAFDGSGRKLIITSSAAVLGDTGNVPLPERARLRPLPGFAWLARLEKEILHSSGGKGIVIRPAWEINGSRSGSWHIAIGHLLRLAKRYGRGTYVGSGENNFSAVHFNGLADLYCLVLKRAAVAQSFTQPARTF